MHHQFISLSQVFFVWFGLFETESHYVHSSGWFGAWNSPASASQVLTLQAFATMASS
jgi:hypothetical protein